MERWDGCVTGWKEGERGREGINPAPSSGLAEEFPPAAAADLPVSTVPVSSSEQRGASRLLLCGETTL